MSRMIERARLLRERVNIGVRGAVESGAVDAQDVAEAVAAWRVGWAVLRGELCVDGGMLYRCLQGHTTQADWRPGVVPALWVCMGEVEPPVEEPGEGQPEDGGGTQEAPAWVQPTGAHDAYATGAVVSHGGQVWRNTADSNAFAPGVHGWEVVA